MFPSPETGILRRDMTIEPGDLRSRLRVCLDLQGAGVTDEELTHMAESYPQCRGKEHWDVRAYVRRTGVGAREYRVVRGSGVQDVYRSADLVRAAAVRMALNDLESQEKSREAPGGIAQERGPTRNRTDTSNQD
jgi:hypothetical protein